MHQKLVHPYLVFILFMLIALPKQLLAQKQKSDFFLETLMKKYPQNFANILEYRDSLRVQIIYTQINRDAHNRPSFKNYYFNLNDNTYFYPASTVKMPVSLLALQKLHELDIPALDLNSTMITESAYSGETSVLNDPTTPDGRPTIAQYIKKIFLVSDNDAFNRLYEFLGPDYINGRLVKMGYEDAEIIHRLQIPLTPDENLHCNPINFFDSNGKLIYTQAMQSCQRKLSQRSDFIGNAYIQNNALIKGPMDFSRKNRLKLMDLHNILISIIFPDAVPKSKRFILDDNDYKFLYKYMSQYPGETKYPSYDTLANRDAYCKFLYWGADTGRLPKDLRIFNKVGDAYGFLTDVSYFVDFNKKTEFFLSATIYCNKDGVLNDDKYDYEDVGYPFMKQLGRTIYAYEASRDKQFLPDLSSFQVKHDN
ncbi:MAG TPA: serine hydrolase [Puia sp.]|jgi:hypothetical protein|nr:serine hydrolase [Puia sp.]